MDNSQFISTLPLLFVAAAAGTSLISFRDNYPVAFKKLSVFWVFNFCVDLAGHITKYYNIGNHWLYNIYFWIMYITLAYLYNQQVQNNYVQKSIRGFYIIFPILIIAETLVNGITELQTIVLVTGSVFMIFLAVFYFRQLYLSEESDMITRDPWFWFSFGCIIYFGCSVPFLGMFNYLWAHYPAFTIFYYNYICNTFAILLNICIITGFLCRRTLQKSR